MHLWTTSALHDMSSQAPDATAMPTASVVRNGVHVAELELPPGMTGLPVFGETFEWIREQNEFFVKRYVMDGKPTVE